jgi:hypothetical protein
MPFLFNGNLVNRLKYKGFLVVADKFEVPRDNRATETETRDPLDRRANTTSTIHVLFHLSELNDSHSHSKHSHANRVFLVVMAKINMTFESTAVSEFSENDNCNDIRFCPTEIDFMAPCRNGNGPLHGATNSSMLSSSFHQACTDDYEDVLDNKPAAITISANTTSNNVATGVSCRPSWWSSRVSVSRRSLLEESLDEIDDHHSLDLITRASKRKANHGRLDDDDDDYENDEHDGNRSDDYILRQMQMFQPITAVRSSKMPRRCQSMFASFPPISNYNTNKNNHKNNVAIMYMNQAGGNDDILPPPVSLFSDGSHSTTSSRTVTETISSEELDDDHVIDNDLIDDDDTTIQASMMGLPVLQRCSTIKDHFDMVTSIETFRTTLLDQKQQQQQEQQN